jgi:hypothetical protein
MGRRKRASKGKAQEPFINENVKTLDQLLRVLYEKPTIRQMLLDMFAISAIQGAAAGPSLRSPGDIAKTAYAIARAMVNERTSS